MTISSYQPASIVPALGMPPPTIASARGETQEFSGRADHDDAHWFVRIVLTADATAVVRSVRVIIEDRDVQQIVLHTVWTDWHDVPMLMAHIPSPLPAQEPPDTIAWNLAAALHGRTSARCRRMFAWARHADRIAARVAAGAAGARGTAQCP